MRNINRQIVLKQRPQGMPQASDFEMIEQPIPEPGEGEVVTKLMWLSIDPYMRGRISAAKSYARGVEPGEVMVGGGVGQVARSRHPNYRPGDLVESFSMGWQDYAKLPAMGLRKLDPAAHPPELALGLLGMPGLTAYFALLDIGQPKPGETVLVSAASGAVGQVVGQIAKIKGCRAVALAGSDDKLAWCRELGFDAAINYKTAGDLSAAIAAECPQVDIYFDNVGGAVHDAAMSRIGVGARIIICGVIDTYNRMEQPDIGPRHLRRMLVNRATMKGFLITDHIARFPQALAELESWRRAGKLKYRQDVTDGLENAPAALARVLSGGNFGKQLIRVAE
jgi:NADPH-dependent curcumin reductase CurA